MSSHSSVHHNDQAWTSSTQHRKFEWRIFKKGRRTSLRPLDGKNHFARTMLELLLKAAPEEDKGHPSYVW